MSCVIIPACSFCTTRRTVQESTLPSLCAACPCERELNFGHLAARCTTTSPGPLRRDFSLLLESTPKHHIGDSGRTLGALCPKAPKVFARCQAAGHFELLRKGCFQADWGWVRVIQKRKIFLFECDAKFSHSFLDHGGKQAAKKRIPRFRPLLISHVRCQILVDSCSLEELFFSWKLQNYGNRDAFGMW